MWILIPRLGSPSVSTGWIELWIRALGALLAMVAVPRATAASELPLRQLRPDIALPGNADRFDYASIDASRRLLFVAHLGSGW